MNKENLEKARELCIRALQSDNIDLVDLCELMINIDYFLDPEDYKDNIETLQQRKTLRKEAKRYGQY